MSLEQRIETIDLEYCDTPVSVADVAPDLLDYARNLCQLYELPFGTLMRRARAISHVEDRRLCDNFFREAARHLVAKAK